MYKFKIRSLAVIAAASFAGVASAPVRADQVIADDLIVQSSICTGFDCVNGENFGTDTLRLKENNLRIHFDDTSASSGFPANDWQLVANDTASGGLNYFAIQDYSNNKDVFVVDAGARSHALHVDAQSNVGLGTATPALDLHIVSGNTPAIRFDQDGTSGWAAYAWDIGANEASFFVRDVFDSSTIPFRIQPGAGDASVLVRSNGGVNFGSTSAAPTLQDGTIAQLYAASSDGDASMLINEGSGTQAARDMLELRNYGNPQLVLQNMANANTWRIGGGKNLVVTRNSSDPTSAIFKLSSVGDLTISGTLRTAASCASGCDRVFSKDFDLDSIAEHAEKMWSAQSLPAVGPTDEDGQFDIAHMTGGMLNELEKAHIYIAQLEQRLGEQQADAAAREAALEARLARIEAALAAQH